MELVSLVVIVAIGILLFLFKDKISIFFQDEEAHLPFKRKDFLLNIPERKFFEALQQIIPGDCVVFPQILLSTIVSVESKGKDFWTYQNKINRKTIDFVIFEKQYLKPIIAIEYDGKTHDRSDRQERDVFVGRVLESVGIKSLHVEHQKNINFEEVKSKINEFLNPNPTLKQ
jgi:very-short-patch-repair endonuclease